MVQMDFFYGYLLDLYSDNYNRPDNLTAVLAVSLFTVTTVTPKVELIVFRA